MGFPRQDTRAVIISFRDLPGPRIKPMSSAIRRLIFFYHWSYPGKPHVIFELSVGNYIVANSKLFAKCEADFFFPPI